MGPVLSLDAITEITDHMVRAKEAQRLVVYAESTAVRARAVRDAAIRKARQAGMTVAEIVPHVGVSHATVKVVTRGI
jgi:predicted transcriptional regulator